MKKILIVVVILVIVVVAGFLIFTLNKSRDLSEQNGQEVAGINRGEIREKGEPEDKTVLGNGFSIKVPQGWAEQQNPMGVSLMAVDILSPVSNERARQINFHPYYTVTLDSLQGLEEKQYIEILKQAVAQATPGVIFQNENTLEINANKAYALEGELTQNEIDFKILIILIRGKGNDIWVVSFNTTKVDWDQSASKFTEIANSFLIRD